MGALTIKSYSYQSRPWELSRFCFPNILTSYPEFIMLSFKDDFLVKILPWNRNDFISNKLRFSLNFFFNTFFFINEQKDLFTRKFNLTQIFFLPMIIISYLYGLLKITTVNKPYLLSSNLNNCNYKFNLCSNYYVIHDFLCTDYFYMTLNKFNLLCNSNLNFVTKSYFESFYNFNHCLNDFDSSIFITSNDVLNFPDLYLYIYRKQFLDINFYDNNNNSNFDYSIRDNSNLESLNYPKLFVISTIYNNSTKNIFSFFYRFVLKLINKQIIISISSYLMQLDHILNSYYPYNICYYNGDNNISLLCFFISYNYINSIGFIVNALKFKK